MSGDDAKQVQLDATSLRGIAHPLRVRILGLLREHGPSTATRLADRLGQSTGATSYHLRQLAQYGFVIEEAGRGAGRERWWRAAHRRTLFSTESVAGEADAETDVYLRSVAAAYAERVDRWLGERTTQPPEWSRVSTISDWALRLTPAEAEQFRDQFDALINQYRQDPEGAPDAPDGTRRVVVQLQFMPFGDLPAPQPAGPTPLEPPGRPA